ARRGAAMLGVVRRGPGTGPAAIVVGEEGADGMPFGAPERERFGALCSAAAPARAVARRFRAQQDRALDLISAPASADARRREVARESGTRMLALAARLGVSTVDGVALARVLDLGPWAWSEAGRAALTGPADIGPSGDLKRVHELE